MEQGHKVHLFYGILFTVIAAAALIAIAVIGSRADNATSTATVDNSSPTVDTVITTATTGGSDAGNEGDAGFVIAEGSSTTTIYVRGSASDLNGCEQISTGNGDWKLKLYKTGASNAGSGATCTTADNNDCYNFTESAVTLANCDSGGSDTAVDYEFAAAVQYWIDPTDTSGTWTSKVTVTDSASAAANSTDIFEVGSTVALDASSINYGSLSLGATSTDNTLTVTNTGNTVIDLDISGTAMTCSGTSSANIAAANTHWDLTADVAYGSMTGTLSGTPTDVQLDLAARTSESTASTGSMYFKLAVPSAGVSGTCSNTITLTAK